MIPQPEPKGTGYVWRFDREIVVSLDRWKDDRSGLSAECTITHKEVTITQARLNLTSQPTITKWAKDLDDQTKTVHPVMRWLPILRTVCHQALAVRRQGEPAIALNSPAERIHLPWRVQPLVHEGLPTVLFGPGGLGKSFIGLYTCLLVEAGASGVGLSAVQGRALYLDWEMEALYVQDRCERLRLGDKDLKDAVPLYRRCTQPLADDLEAILQICEEEQVSYLVVDSLAPASGTDQFASSTALSFYTALRMLNRPALVLAHVAKHSDSKTIYGSVFFENLARSVWELDGDGEGKVVLLHKKVNHCKKQPAIGIDLQFTDVLTTFHVLNPDEFYQQAKVEGPKQQSVLDCLLEAPKTVKEIAHETGVGEAYVRTTLSRAKDQGQAMKLKTGKWILLKGVE